eukprot:scaffold13266_cov147-Isochrysis_galbana.AAC.1
MIDDSSECGSVGVGMRAFAVLTEVARLTLASRGASHDPGRCSALREGVWVCGCGVVRVRGERARE